MSEKRKIIGMNHEGMKIIADALNLKVDRCYYCKKKIENNDKFGIFSHPERVVCDSVVCLSKAID